MHTEEQIIVLAANKLAKMDDKFLSTLTTLKIPVSFDDGKDIKHALVIFEKVSNAGGGHRWMPFEIKRN